MCFEFCQVGGLAIIHKRKEPNLARGQSDNKVKFLRECCLVLATNRNSLSKYGNI
jgi:hypothetical protein